MGNNERRRSRMRYFARLGKDNQAVNLYRFEVGDTAMVEDRWSPNGWVENMDADIARYLVEGQGDFQEVSEEVARKIFPQIGRAHV